MGHREPGLGCFLLLSSIDAQILLSTLLSGDMNVPSRSSVRVFECSQLALHRAPNICCVCHDFCHQASDNRDGAGIAITCLGFSRLSAMRYLETDF
ncbi:uncharacterized protein IWZ02DRAFT_57348 [Phyllosticta citriasiana]|uniref:uncharacterized protein n=1 Tax=Phyllosticta citriasiana TaxID=595635 RepID=UPI0030FDA085